MTARHLEGWTGRVFVRLLEIPERRRKLAAERVIRSEGLVGYDALELMEAAVTPQSNPGIFVDAELARRVLGR